LKNAKQTITSFLVTVLLDGFSFCNEPTIFPYSTYPDTEILVSGFLLLGFQNARSLGKIIIEIAVIAGAILIPLNSIARSQIVYILSIIKGSIFIGAGFLQDKQYALAIPLRIFEITQAYLPIFIVV